MTHHRPNPGTLAGDGDFLTGSEGPKNTPTPKNPQPVPSIIARHFDLSDVGTDTAILIRSDGAECLIDKADHARFSQYRYSPGGTKGRYMSRTAMINGKQRRIYLHRELMSPPPGFVVDHVNGNPLDNRRSNLRICTYSQNGANRTVSHNSYGFVGIGFDPVQVRFQGAVTQDGARFRGPWRLTAIEAAKDYDAMARGLHGEFARLNFPEPGEQGVTRPGGAL